ELVTLNLDQATISSHSYTKEYLSELRAKTPVMLLLFQVQDNVIAEKFPSTLRP
ncbi:24308_t:CDS:1, partial [Dentiscutata erythropus]